MDKELIKIFSEREAALIRIEINEHFNEAKSELERLKSENEKLNQAFDEKIRTVKSDVSDVATLCVNVSETPTP
jgi:DNA repair exonuclease SbcCD ATPase subunit